MPCWACDAMLAACGRKTQVYEKYRRYSRTEELLNIRVRAWDFLIESRCARGRFGLTSLTLALVYPWAFRGFGSALDRVDTMSRSRLGGWTYRQSLGGQSSGHSRPAPPPLPAEQELSPQFKFRGLDYVPSGSSTVAPMQVIKSADIDNLCRMTTRCTC